MAITGLDKLIIIPTTDIHFPLVLAVISVGYMLLKQIQLTGLGKTLHSYLPVTGSGIIEGQSLGAKIGDIFMSMFMGILDIV